MDRFRPLVLVNRFWVAKRHWVIGGLVLATVGSVAPAAVSVTNSLSVISAQKEQVQNYRQNLEAMTRTQGELEQELKRIGDERSRVVNAAVSGQVISEEELAYWRKQMDAFGLAKNMSLKVIGRGSSPYKQAVRIDVQIAPAGYNQTSSATVTIGGVSATFSSTTASPSSLTASPSSVSFTNVFTNSSGSQTITLTNPNPLAATLTPTLSGATEFSLTGNTCTSGIAANNGTCTLTVTFTPGTSTTAKTGTLALGFNGQTIALSGTGVAPDSTPDAFSFTAATGVALSTVTTSNTVTITGINTPASISVSGTGTNQQCSIAGGAWGTCSGTISNNQTIAVRHTTSASYNTATTTVLTVGGTSATYTATTRVLQALTVSPTSLAWGSVALNASSSKTLTITNPNTWGVSFTTSITSGSTYYSVASNSCSNTVPASGTCTVTVNFNPLATTTAQSGQLDIDY